MYLKNMTPFPFPSVWIRLCGYNESLRFTQPISRINVRMREVVICLEEKEPSYSISTQGSEL